MRSVPSEEFRGHSRRIPGTQYLIPRFGLRPRFASCEWAIQRRFLPRARAIALGATAIIIVHNHPSGDPTPSQQDIRLTRDLIDAGRHMKVAVHDRIIVGAQGCSSMKAGADLA